MIRAQQRAVAAMRAIGGTVTGAPPLRLPPPAEAAWSSRPSRSVRQAWRLWLVPAAAALAVVAVAVSLVLARSAPETSAASPGAAAPAASSAGGAPALGPEGVPPYYVALPVAFGWYAYAPPTEPAGSGGLVVGSTATGKRLADVAAPAGLTFNVVTGAADDRTFVVGATSISSLKGAEPNWTETWYLLTISPGSAHVARLSRLPVPAVPNVTGVAISPDGTELAVAYQQLTTPPAGSASGSPGLTLWSVATGRALRHWGTPKGQVTASTPAAGYSSDALNLDALATALRWTPDGRELAFAWNGAAIRLLNLVSAASGQGDLVKASTLRAVTGTGYTPAGSSDTCDPAGGWSLSTGAVTFTCAGAVTPASPATGPGCGKAAPAHPAFIQEIKLGGGASETTTLAQSLSCTSASSPAVENATLGWSSADGARVIGAFNAGFGNARYGVYTRNKFAALPALPGAGSPTTVAW
jgi:hypothetical protein